MIHKNYYYGTSKPSSNGLMKYRKWCNYGCGKRVELQTRMHNNTLLIYRCLICDRKYIKTKSKELIEIKGDMFGKIDNTLL